MRAKWRFLRLFSRRVSRRLEGNFHRSGLLSRKMTRVAFISLKHRRISYVTRLCWMPAEPARVRMSRGRTARYLFSFVATTNNNIRGVQLKWYMFDNWNPIKIPGVQLKSTFNLGVELESCWNVRCIIEIPYKFVVYKSYWNPAAEPDKFHILKPLSKFVVYNSQWKWNP